MSKEENLTVRTKDQRTAGYDLCYSVPKSVSVYLALTGDQAVEPMINEAFRETLVDVEARMETRVRDPDGEGNQRHENRTTGNMVYAAFVHTVTRVAWTEGQFPPIVRFWCDDGAYWGVPFHQVLAANYNPEVQTLLIYWSLGSILIAGPKAEAVFEQFSEHKIALVKADGNRHASQFHALVLFS